MVDIVAYSLVAYLRIHPLFQGAIHVVKRMRCRSTATFDSKDKNTWLELAVVPAHSDIFDRAHRDGRTKLAEAGLSPVGIRRRQGCDTRSFTIDAGRGCGT